MSETNWYGEAISAIEDAEANVHNETYRDHMASIAAAKATLALCDAIYNLRGHVEALPARIERRLDGR